MLRTRDEAIPFVERGKERLQFIVADLRAAPTDLADQMVMWMLSHQFIDCLSFDETRLADDPRLAELLQCAIDRRGRDGGEPLADAGSDRIRREVIPALINRLEDDDPLGSHPHSLLCEQRAIAFEMVCHPDLNLPNTLPTRWAIPRLAHRPVVPAAPGSRDPPAVR